MPRSFGETKQHRYGKQQRDWNLTQLFTNFDMEPVPEHYKNLRVCVILNLPVSSQSRENLLHGGNRSKAYTQLLRQLRTGRGHRFVPELPSISDRPAAMGCPACQAHRTI